MLTHFGIKDFIDVLIIYSELNGDFDKYIFIDKIKQIDSKIKIIIMQITVPKLTFFSLI